MSVDFIGNLLATGNGSMTGTDAFGQTVSSPTQDSRDRFYAGSSSSTRGSMQNIQPFPEGSQSVAVHILRYALLFVNMMFVLSSMLMVVAGTMMRGSSALLICERCRNLAIVPVTLGAILWLFAMSGFYAAKRRNVSMLLVYGVFIIFLSVAIVGVLISTVVMIMSVNQSNGNDNLANGWSNLVATDPDTACDLQRQLKCSGFGVPFGTNGSVCPPPPCASNTFPSPCINELEDSLRHGLVAFLVMMFTSFLLIIAAVVFAWALKSNRPKK